MNRYVAFFASMNVGGNRLAMADLRHALRSEEVEDVETVVSSGNVLFSCEERPSEGLAEMLAWVVQDRFGFDTFAVVRNAAELRQAIAENPFASSGQADRVHTHFLEAQPLPDHFADLIATWDGRGPERIAAGNRCLHVDYVEAVGSSRLSTAFIARKLGCRGTARNLRSMQRILDKMEA